MYLSKEFPDGQLRRTATGTAITRRRLQAAKAVTIARGLSQPPGAVWDPAAEQTAHVSTLICFSAKCSFFPSLLKCCLVNTGRLCDDLTVNRWVTRPVSSVCTSSKGTLKTAGNIHYVLHSDHSPPF